MPTMKKLCAFAAAGLALVAAAPCGDGEGSCPAEQVSSEIEVSAREADETEALKVQLLQSGGIRRSGSPLRHATKVDRRQTQASRICIENKAGFVLSWKLWDTVNNKEMPYTEAYAAPGLECRNINQIPDVNGGDPIVAVIKAQAGKTVSLRSVIYDPDADLYNGSANFTCKGGTGGYSCTLGDGEDAMQLPAPKLPAWAPSVTAKSVCVNNNGGFRLRFKLWDTATNNVGSESNGFDMGGNKCQEGADLQGVQEGHPLALVVDPQGSFPLVFKTILYDPSASAATFTCSGTTGSYDCTLLGA